MNPAARQPSAPPEPDQAEPVQVEPVQVEPVQVEPVRAERRSVPEPGPQLDPDADVLPDVDSIRMRQELRRRVRAEHPAEPGGPQPPLSGGRHARRGPDGPVGRGPRLDYVPRHAVSTPGPSAVSAHAPTQRLPMPGGDSQEHEENPPTVRTPVPNGHGDRSGGSIPNGRLFQRDRRPQVGQDTQPQNGQNGQNGQLSKRDDDAGPNETTDITGAIDYDDEADDQIEDDDRYDDADDAVYVADDADDATDDHTAEGSATGQTAAIRAAQESTAAQIAKALAAVQATSQTQEAEVTDEAGSSEELPPGKRVRVVLSQRKGTAVRPVRTVVDVQELTQVGELLSVSLIRSQLALALRIGGIAAIAIGSLPAIFVIFPVLGRVELFGLRLPWLLLGVLAYPFMLGLGYLHSRSAERLEQVFADHIQN